MILGDVMSITRACRKLYNLEHLTALAHSDGRTAVMKELEKDKEIKTG